MEHLTIETPEQTALEFPLAGVGSRFLALAFDTLIQLLIALGLLIIAALLFTTVLEGKSRGGPWAMAILVVIGFLIQFGYFALFEAVSNGQTPGKRRLNLRVIKDSGRPITVYDAVARNLLRIVDSIPGFYAVGILVAFFSSENKRLGDYLAGTVVVRESFSRGAEGSDSPELKTYSVPSVAPASIFHLSEAPARRPESRPPAPSGYDAGRLSTEEFDVIETFLRRRGQLAPEVRIDMSQRIIEKISTRLSVRPDDRRFPEALLEKLANEYRDCVRFRNDPGRTS